jgi:Rrf2 family iron-sulfur cluster assembly transcriptional regulator
MKLSHAASYALHALAHLARQPPGRLVTSRAIAAADGVSEALLRQAIVRLAEAGVLISIRGNGGGYRLARPAPDITLLEVVEAVDGPIRGEAPTDFATAQDGLDTRLARVCEGAAAAVREMLGRVRLSELVQG